MNKTQVTISRKWHRPQIETTVSKEGIDITIELDDFIQALIQEIGSVTWVFTDTQFRIKLNQAIANVLQGVKEESAKVV